jgi:hypothetical protein
VSDKDYEVASPSLLSDMVNWSIACKSWPAGRTMSAVGTSAAF